MLDISDHVERVEAAVSSSSAAARCRVAASWCRSKTLHQLNPAEQRRIHHIAPEDLRKRLQAEEVLLHHAANEMDRLFPLLTVPRSGLFLSDKDGVVLDSRCANADVALFDSVGLTKGADFSEAREGTNGIGTCAIEQTPLIIANGQHFFARNRAFTCVAAPVFGIEGDLIGVLAFIDATEVPGKTSQTLVASAISQAARRIESHLFRQQFQAHRIILAHTNAVDDLALLAVDQDDFVVGATRAARLAFRSAVGQPFAPRPAVELLGQEAPARDMHDIRRTAILQALHRASGNVSAAARQLGMGRATLYNQMKRLDIRPS